MSALLERLREEAKQLPIGEQIELGTQLIRAGRPGDGDGDELDLAANEQAWDEEILRRVEEIRSGKVEMISASTVYAELDEMLRCKKA